MELAGGYMKGYTGAQTESDAASDEITLFPTALAETAFPVPVVM